MSTRPFARLTAAVLACLGGGLGVVGCSGCTDGPAVPAGSSVKNDRSQMAQSTVTIKGHTFNAAVARSHQEQQIGLMNVTADELGQDEGMLFVFSSERPLSFWMKNTLIPLDIAFINASGRIVRIHTMKALDLSSYASGTPAMYALEVHAGRFAALSIVEGDTVEFGDSLAP